MNEPSHYMNILAKLASSMTKVANARICACIVHKNTIASFGMNQLKSHPFQAKFGTNKDSIFLHAEVDAIKNALKCLSVDDLKKSTLYICRVKTVDNKECWGLSKPCIGCARAIATFDLRAVYYSNDYSAKQKMNSYQSYKVAS